MSDEELKEEIGKLLRGLRTCDTQATSVAWMKRAFTAMESCLPLLEPRSSFVVVPARPIIEIAKSLPTKQDVRYIQDRQIELRSRSLNQTVVYPEVFQPPGLRVAPKPWTREDTLRLERAAKLRAGAVARQYGVGR